jgi:predicted phosphodiesterase
VSAEDRHLGGAQPASGAGSVERGGTVADDADGAAEARLLAGAHLGIELAAPALELVWADRRIVVVHDPRDLETRHVLPHVVLHGHTHRRTIERTDGRLVFNPGECAGHLPGHNAVGLVDLATLEVEILTF